MAGKFALAASRVGWWAGAEPADPLAALTGWLLRKEVASRCPGFSPVLVLGAPVSWAAPGFTGEPAVLQPDGTSPLGPPIDVFVASGNPEPGGPKLAQSLSESGTACAVVAPGEAWELMERLSVGPPFAVPEPAVLAARHLSRSLLDARRAYLRVAEGLPRNCVLVEGSLFSEDSEDAGLDLALARLARGAAGERSAEVVRLAPGPLCADDAEVSSALRRRRSEVEEGRYQPEDWEAGGDSGPWPLRITSPIDLAAAVAGARVVVATSAPLMALAWALGVPHVALGREGSPASGFAAWTGDATAVAEDPGEVVATIDNIFARRGAPPGLARLEATLDQALDEAVSDLEKEAAGAAEGQRAGNGEERAAERLRELGAANGALRMRMAAERLRFGERAAFLEQAANTAVESAIKAVHGQDVMLRRRLEETEKEMHRLQEETAVQQAELRRIYGTLTWRALGPLRQWYGRAAGSASPDKPGPGKAES